VVGEVAGGVGELHTLTYSFTDTYRRPVQMRPGCTRDSCNWKCCCVVRGRPTRRDVASAAAVALLASNVTTEVSREARASSTRSARPPCLFGGATRIDEDTPVSQLALSEVRACSSRARVVADAERHGPGTPNERRRISGGGEMH
jgi:hypothetical protein